VNTVLSLKLLFISEDEWCVECHRDRFLHLLLDHLDVIETCKHTKVCWTDELEALLWTDPQLPPWRLDRDWKLQIVPVLNRLLRQNQVHYELHGDLSPAAVSPEGELQPLRQDLHRAFLRMMHALIIDTAQIYFCCGAGECASGPLAFCCTCHAEELRPTLVRDPREWVLHLVDHLWPSHDAEVAAFHRLVAMTVDLFALQTGMAQKQQAVVQRRFVRSILGAGQRRGELLAAVAKRLTLTQAQASADNSLQDEPLRGSRGIRRFRVGGAARVHYRYGERQTIVLVKYYPEGKHDAGLR
jgi:hypothetical protein